MITFYSPKNVLFCVSVMSFVVGSVRSVRAEYDAMHGRFLQRDPAGYVDGMNLYGYARSNPAAYVDPDGRQVQEFYHLFASGKFASNAEIERALESGDLELAHMESALLLDASNAAGALLDPEVLLNVPRGFTEGFYSPKVAATTSRFTSVISAQLEAGATLGDATSYPFLAGLFIGDLSGVTPFLEGSFGVDLATNQLLTSSESLRRRIQGGSMLVTAVAAPYCTRTAAGRGTSVARATGDISLPVINRHFVPNPTSVLQRLTNSMNSRLGSDLRLAKSVLTQAEYRLGHSHQKLAPAVYGRALEKLAAQAIENDSLLSQLYRHTGSRPGPDFIGVGSAAGRKFEMTTNTARTIAAHLRRPYGHDLIIISYERPINFTVFPPP